MRNDTGSSVGQHGATGGGGEGDDDEQGETALRETEEEIGHGRRHVDVVGRLETYDTVTGFRITPVIGMIAPGFSLELDPFEVDHDSVFPPAGKGVSDRFLLDCLEGPG